MVSVVVVGPAMSGKTSLCGDIVGLCGDARPVFAETCSASYLSMLIDGVEYHIWDTPRLDSIDSMRRGVKGQLMRSQAYLPLTDAKRRFRVFVSRFDTLILALKGLEEDRREQFFGAMSSRAADGLRDEIEMRGRVKKTEVETAQKEIVAIAKRLIAQGDLMLGEGDEDYV